MKLSPTLSFVDALSSLQNHNVVLEDVRARYCEPWRHYHTLEHITSLTDILLRAEQDGVVITDGAACVAFVFWHDAIHDPESKPGWNEYRSAQLCGYQFGNIGDSQSVARAMLAITESAGHNPSDCAEFPELPLLMDCDLSILGSPEEEFFRYDQNIRNEYMLVDWDVYARKRAEILRGFLSKPRIYQTDWAHVQWEAQARKNIASAVLSLLS